MPSILPAHNGNLIAVSRAHPIVTLVSTDLGGPRYRQRVVVRGGQLPQWLEQYSHLTGAGFDVLAVAMGRATLGSSTRIQSVVVYPAQFDRPEMAYVYVEELQPSGKAQRDAAPVHAVRCAPLPERVRFVELAPRQRAQTSLKLV